MSSNQEKLELVYHLLVNVVNKYGRLIIIVILGVIVTYFLAPQILESPGKGNILIKLVAQLVLFSVSCCIIALLSNKIKRLTPKTNCKVIILAAGKSGRWIGSFNKDSDYFWKNLGLTRPKGKQYSHKSLALVNRNTLIQWAISKFLRNGISSENINIIVSNSTPAQQEIAKYVDKLNALCEEKVMPWPIDQKGLEIAYSAYFGMAKIPWNYRGDIIVAYSDIAWEDRLLRKILDEQKGDIVIMVDETWPKNYPPERIWHDKLCAEVVFKNDDGHIVRVGEAVHRFEGIPTWKEDSSRAEAFNGFLNKCSGEVVGLFKFSYKGRRHFVDEFSKIWKGTNEISPTKWKEASESTPSYSAKNRPIRLAEEALLGDFLEYLAKQKKVSVRTVKVQGGWAEIDHWGDAEIAEKRTEHNNPHPLHLACEFDVYM